MVITESVQGETFDCWKAANEKSYVLGDFVWTAMDYLGENGIGRWQFDSIPYGHGDDKLFPWRGAYCGDIDITGFRKPISHYRNIVWERGEKLFISVQQPTLNKRKIFPQRWGVFPSQSIWSWPGFENELIKVEVYSRCDSVALYQDDKLVGGKPTTEREQFKAKFELTYKQGTLKAVGYINGEPIETQELKTAGSAASIRLTADRINLQADGMDLSFISVEIVDKNGLSQPSDDREITFFIEGQGVIQGVGSADLTSLEPYNGNTCKTFQGRALVVVKTQKNEGSISLKASSNGLKSEIINLKSNTVLIGNGQF
jgi:beta-galactosidase